MRIAHTSGVATLLLIGLSANPAQAASYNLNLILTNPGFESGLASWSYSGTAVNANYLTGPAPATVQAPAPGTEWTDQTWASSSPFYTDAQLAINYPGKPWGLNPNITHIQQTGGPVDPTTVIAAAIGANFVGSRQDGYEGHCQPSSSGCGTATPAATYDTNFQIYQAIVGTFAVNDTFSLTIWGNRGRLNEDSSTVNGNTSGSESRITAAVCSQTNLNNPCASGAVQTFTNWSTDGQWTSQTLNWTLTSVAASQDIRIQLTGINQNHDRYVALDLGQQVPVPGAVWLLGSALGALGWMRRARR